MVAKLSTSITAFTAWLDRVGYDSYDPYDLWGTRYGLCARRLYYAKNPIGLPLIAPILAVETLLPSVRKLFVRKQRFATADAQLLLAFLNLHALGDRDRPGCSSPLETRNSKLETLHLPPLSASIPSASDGEKVAGGRMRCPQESGEWAGGEVSNVECSALFTASANSPLATRHSPLEIPPLSASIGDLSRLGIDERNSPPVKAQSAPSERARASHWARGEVSSCASATLHLQRAIALGEDLLAISIPGYHGHCWGYPFDWQNNHGLWKKNTPFITATPYCFEAFLGLFDATEDSRYLDVAKSIARFVHEDLHDTPTSADAAAGSYSPIDHSEVINASAYRAMVLFEAAERFNNNSYAATAQRNLNFILQNQRDDGAWLYALDHPSERFIDHFHTCFVLKNLAKLNRRAKSAAVSTAIEKGYDYYRRELFSADGMPKSFAVQPRTQLVKLDLYNFAEAITLGTTLPDEIPQALVEAQRLALVLVSKYQLPAGYFVSRVFIGGGRHTFPFLRWPQSQLFYALTNLLRALESTSTPPVPSGISAGRDARPAASSLPSMVQPSL